MSRVSGEFNRGKMTSGAGTEPFSSNHENCFGAEVWGLAVCGISVLGSTFLGKSAFFTKDWNLFRTENMIILDCFANLRVCFLPLHVQCIFKLFSREVYVYICMH